MGLKDYEVLQLTTQLIPLCEDGMFDFEEFVKNAF